MSVMFEVLYRSPPSIQREAEICKRIEPFGGRLTYREEPKASGPVCLTYEFSDPDSAEQAANVLRTFGEHVEGPVEYGDD